MTRHRWILGNWKQHQLRADAVACTRAVRDGLAALRLPPSVHVGIAPTYVTLADVARESQDALWVLAQDVGAQESGAFTGEVGPSMLRDVGARAAIVGHSERRALFGEDDALIARKTGVALAAGLTVVLCVGESLAIRESNRHEAYVLEQLAASLTDLSVPDAGARLVIAYEPVWAIGTGRTASPTQANDMHGAIRTWLGEQFGEVGRGRSILYGGSVKPTNAAELSAQADVDGFLVGGASLQPSDFLAIVRAAVEAEAPSA